MLTRDELLNNVMLYWCTATAGSSARMYYESFHAESATLTEVKVPMGGCIYPKEIIRVSRRWAEKRYTNVIHWTTQEIGGHFAAFEQPDLYMEDVRKFARLVR